MSGRAPADSASRRISASPRETSAAFELSPSERPSAPPAARAMTFFAAAHSSTPTTSSLTYTRKRTECTATCTRTASSRSSLATTAAAGSPRDDLIGDGRTGEDSDRTVANESRQPCSRGGIEPLGQADNRRAARKLRYDVAEDTARNGDDDELGVRDRRVGNRHGDDVGEVCRLRVTRIPASRIHRIGLRGIARRECHLVAVVPKESRRPPSPTSPLRPTTILIRT